MSRKNGKSPNADGLKLTRLRGGPSTRMVTDDDDDDENSPNKSWSSSSSSISPPSSCVSSEGEQQKQSGNSPEAAAATSMVLAGCPQCLMYVMLAEHDPRCPKCKSTVLLDFKPPSGSRTNKNRKR